MMEAAYRSGTGQMSATASSPLQTAANIVQTAGLMALLPRAVLSSLGEYLAIGVRSHAPVREAAHSLIDIGKDLTRALAGGGPDAAKEVGEAIGILGDAATDLILSARFDAAPGGKIVQKTTARFFRTTMLHQLTEHQRLVAVRAGQRMIARLVEDVATNSPRKVSAQRLLDELGVDGAQAAALGKWLKANEGRVPVDKLWEKGPAEAYRTALQRFVDEAIQNPTAADRPALANHPAGRMAYGITSFMFSFTRNVLFRTLRETAEAVSVGKGYTMEDRLRLAGPVIGLSMLSFVQSQFSDLRDAVLNPERSAERTDQERFMTNLSRSGAFGTLDPFVNYFLSARYERDPTSLLSGPYLAFYADFIANVAGLLPGLNSPKTTNAENRAVKSGYQAVAAPAAAAVASWMPGGTPLRMAYGAALITGTAPGTANKVADAIAGERTIKPKKGEKQPRTVGTNDMSLDLDSDLSYGSGTEKGFGDLTL